MVQAKGIDNLALGGSGSIDADPLRGAKVHDRPGRLRLDQRQGHRQRVAVGHRRRQRRPESRRRRRAEAVGVDRPARATSISARLQSIDASVNIAGSGEAKIAVRDRLNVTIAGSGDVNYYGDPKVSKTVVGSGSANRLGGSPR